MSEDWRDILSSLDLSGEPGAPEPEPQPRNASAKARRKVSMFYERKGRAGKPATILADFEGLDDGEIDELASELKRRLGTGGSCRGGEILIQGDRRNELKKLLADRGFTVKG